MITTTRRKDVCDENGHAVRELHGVTLAQILEYLVKHVGFATLADQIPINCFAVNPSIKSSLVFLRRTPWARTRVETLYIDLRTYELGGGDLHTQDRESGKRESDKS